MTSHLLQLTELAQNIPPSSRVHAAVIAALALADEEHAANTLEMVRRQLGAEEMQITKAMTIVQRDLSRAALANPPVWALVASIVPSGRAHVMGEPRGAHDGYDFVPSLQFRAPIREGLEVIAPIGSGIAMLSCLQAAMPRILDYVGSSVARGNAEQARRACLLNLSEKAK